MGDYQANGHHDAHTALILSGGGARGAYQIGVMRALFSGAAPSTGHRPIRPGIYTGASVGGYNSAFMVSQPDVPPLATLDALEKTWRHRIASTPTSCGNGVFRIRGMPLQGLDPGCLLDPVGLLRKMGQDSLKLSAEAVSQGYSFIAETSGPLTVRVLNTLDLSAFIDCEPFEQLIETTIDFDGIRRGSRKIAIPATNWDRGTTRVFHQKDLDRNLGPRVVAATAAIPGLFPPVQIERDDYVDGGVLLNSPLQSAISMGAHELHVVFLDPELKNSSLNNDSTMDVVAHLFSIITASHIREDIKSLRRINQALELLAGGGRADLGDAEIVKSLGHLGRIVERHESGEGYRPLTLHVYRPEVDLGGGADIINFSIENVNNLIEMGYRDTVEHNCDEAKCIHVSLGTSSESRRRPRHAESSQPRKDGWS